MNIKFIYNIKSIYIQWIINCRYEVGGGGIISKKSKYSLTINRLPKKGQIFKFKFKFKCVKKGKLLKFMINMRKKGFH